MGRMRAAKGGQTLAGQHFKGGQFIPLGIQIKAGLISGDSIKGTVADFTRNLEKAIERAKRGNLSAAAYLLMVKAKGSIRGARKRQASIAGTPPHAHVGWFRGAVRYSKYDRERQDVVIGFIHSRVGKVAATHEHGLREEGRSYPQRATMEPALRAVLSQFHNRWRASVG